MQKILFWLLIFTAQTCFADCKSLAETFAKKLHPELRVDPALIACKAMPDDAAKTIVILVFESDGAPQNEGDSIRSAEILVLGDNDKTIKSQLFEKGTESAYSFNEVTIDKAQYKLSSEFQAFGVRTDRSKSTEVGDVSMQDLNLYVVRGENINHVLRLQTHSLLKWDGKKSDSCSFSTVEVKRTVATAKTEQNRFADLSGEVSKHMVDAHLNNGKCEQSENNSNDKYLLHFGDKQYIDKVP